MTGYTGTNCQYGKLEVLENLKKVFCFLKNKCLKKALPCTLSSPCLNNAKCTNNNLGGYTCTCLTGYTGTNCQYGTGKIKL